MTGLKWWQKDLYDGPAFTWDLLYLCNYRCSYCWFEQAGSWNDLAKRYPLAPAERWTEVWDRLHAKYGRCRIDVLGGEPFVYPSAIDLFTRLSAKHFVWINTNLSLNWKNLERLAAEADPESLHIHASLHPEFADVEDFFKKTAFLRDRGFPPTVCAVSYPPLVPRLEEFRRRLDEQGLPLTTLVFRGTYEGKRYPESFTPAEREVLHMDSGLAAGDGAKWAYQVERERTLGKPCLSGQVYGNIRPDGAVYRCGAAGPGEGTLGYVGNVFEKDFALWEKATACPVEKCSCQEYIYLLDVQKRLRPDFLARSPLLLAERR